jgi:hypothetical protein
MPAMEHLAPPKGNRFKEEPMFRNLVKKRTVLTLGVVAVLAVAGVAVAFWTTTGSGSGTGSVAATNGTLTLHGTITNALTPGSSSPVAFTADNAGSSSLQVGTIEAVVSIDQAHVEKGCEASDFTILGTIEHQVIAAHASGTALAKEGSISMADTAANQDGCQGATISLALTS